MRMTHIISKMSSFFADSTLSHDSTSLTLIFNVPIVTDGYFFCKQKVKIIPRLRSRKHKASIGFVTELPYKYKQGVSFSIETGYNIQRHSAGR